MNLIDRSVRTATDLISQGRLEDSELVCRQILRVDEKNPNALCLLSCCLHRLGREEESAQIIEEAVSVVGSGPEIYNSLGLAFMHARDMEKAKSHFAKASEMSPEDENPVFNIGSCLMMEGRHKEALVAFRESYARSRSARSMVGMACAKAEMLDTCGAISLLEMVLERDPEDPLATTSISSVLHLAGRWDDAWKFYPSRLGHYEHIAKKVDFLGLKLWSKGPPPAKKILVFSEQGIGDAINFGRMSLVLKDKFPGLKVGVYAPESIRNLLESQGIPTVDGPEGFEACCSMMDIPGLLNMSMEEVYDSFIPIKAGGTCHMSEFDEFFKVGVCWAGNPAHPKDMWRSCRLDWFKNLDLPGVKMFSLQKDLRQRIWPCSPAPVDLSADSGGMRLVNMSPHMNSWEATATIISGLDLVVSVDTSIMHLSAAMGKETWGLIPYVPDWRWGLGSEKTCWYPDLRLFRQKTPGDWRDVFSSVRKELESRMTKVKP